MWCPCLQPDAPLVDVECVLRMETSQGWEDSMTKVLESFEDLSYEINPAAGFTYLKGKADPQQIITQLSKGGTHAKIEWLSNGFRREDQNQVQPSGHYYNHLDPFYHHATYPYPYQNNIYQFNPPYPNWHNNSQNALPYGNNHVPQQQHNGHNMFEGGSFSGRTFDFHCPVRSNHHDSDSGDLSPPNNQTNEQPIQPTQPKPSGFLKKLVEKLCFKC